MDDKKKDVFDYLEQTGKILSGCINLPVVLITLLIAIIGIPAAYYQYVIYRANAQAALATQTFLFITPITTPAVTVASLTPVQFPSPLTDTPLGNTPPPHRVRFKASGIATNTWNKVYYSLDHGAEILWFEVYSENCDKTEYLRFSRDIRIWVNIPPGMLIHAQLYVDDKLVTEGDFDINGISVTIK